MIDNLYDLVANKGDEESVTVFAGDIKDVIQDRGRWKAIAKELKAKNAAQVKVVETAKKLISSRPGDLSWDEAWYAEEIGEQILTILGKLEVALRELDTIGAHQGDPCIHCGTPHDEVVVGDCPGGS